MPTMAVAVVALLIPFLISASKYTELDGRIVNGIPISSAGYPWMVMLRAEVTQTLNGTNVTITNSSQYCGAALINLSPPIILTAAHCVDGIFNFSTNTTTYQWFADINRTYEVLNTPNDTYYTLPMYPGQLHIHPNWSWSPYDGHDIALFISNESLPESAQIKLEPYLPTISNVVPCCESDEALTIIGYGAIATGGNDSTVLRTTSMRYVNKMDCGQQLVNLIKEGTLVNGSLPQNLTYIDGAFGVDIDATEVTTIDELDDVLNEFLDTTNIYDNRLICIIGNDTDACNGDSGGPLFKTSDDPMDITLLGITSFGPDGACNSGIFTGYTDIASYYEWIVNVTGMTFTSAPSVAPTIYQTNDPIATDTESTTEIPQTDGAKIWIGNWLSLCITLLYLLM